MGSIDDRTFSSNFTGDGIQKLRDQVGEKLKEFMGEYTDDALVEYVIVLLKNGRRKEEAKNELNVFLGDDSDSFVSWLWDHLSANISLYVEPCLDEETKLKPSSERNSKRDSESDRGESKARHKRDWKGLARDPSDPPPLRSSDIDKRPRERERARRSRKSPPRHEDKKRSRIEDRQEYKREASGASMRLLQFAVRDAVAKPRPAPEASSLKRLRSVVSMPNEDSSVVEHPRRIKPVAKVPNGMASVIKAVAEAAEDSVRAKSSSSVFDRLGRGTESHIEKASIDDVVIQKRSAYLQRRGGQNDDMDVHPSGGNRDIPARNVDKPAIPIPIAVSAISGNANTWKPPQYQAAEAGIRDVTVNGHAKADAHPQKAVQTSTGNVVEDVESRTVFVSNVHFGATKDGVSCHFNKFGEVVKVVIVRDAATGQPTGSAYVEFSRKEAADNALSLDGTSFMSRLLKVVKKSGGEQETTMVWAPFQRAMAVRGRRGRGRSFQWKRQDSASASRGGLTYVRTEAKTS